MEASFRLKSAASSNRKDGVEATPQSPGEPRDFCEKPFAEGAAGDIAVPGFPEHPLPQRGMHDMQQDTIISLENIAISFDGEQVLDDLNLRIKNGEFVTLLGPSGCGKTTTLRIIGGFVTPDSGDVFFDGVRINDLPAYKRRVNTIFQRYALFPHMNVYENVAFGLRVQKKKNAEIKATVEEMLAMVNLKGFEHRSVSTLSGGQQQRVAIARALATHPKILLCDEATSALDPQTTQSILSLIRDIHDRLGITVIIITHQMSVVEQICTRVAILDNGTVAEEGAVSEVFSAPQSQAAKRLVYPDGYDTAAAVSGDETVIRVVFNGAGATQTPLIAQMAMEQNIAASILSASTRSIGDKAYGNMLLGIPGGKQQAAKAIAYLSQMPNILVEEVQPHAE